MQQSQPVVLNQSYVWEVLPPRFDADIDAITMPLWERVGLFDEYGHFGIYFTGETEGEEFNKELGAILLRAIEAVRLQHIAYLRCGRGVGRPRNPMTVPLARDLLAWYLRFHDFAGRHSVVKIVNGKPVQVECGPALQFFTLAIEPLNRVLVEELHRKPLSPARLLRAALHARRHPS